MTNAPKPGDRVRANKRFAYRTGEMKENSEGLLRPVHAAIEEGSLGTVLDVREQDGSAIVRWDDGLETGAAAQNVDAA